MIRLTAEKFLDVPGLEQPGLVGHQSVKLGQVSDLLCGELEAIQPSGVASAGQEVELHHGYHVLAIVLGCSLNNNKLKSQGD